MIKRAACFIFLILLSSVCCARQPAFLHLTRQDGLPSNTIYDIYRNSEGFLWIGTNNGAARYNGVKFEHFTTFNGLPDNEIFFFQEDYNRRLWISTFNGQLCYYKNEVFHNAENTLFLKLPFKSSDTKFIKLHKDSSISVAFFNQLNLFVNIKDNRLRVIDIKKYNLHNIGCILKPEKNKFEIIAEAFGATTDSNGNLLKMQTFPVPYLFSYVQDSCYMYNLHGVYSTTHRLLHAFTEPLSTSINRIFISGSKVVICTREGVYINGEKFLANHKISSVTRDLAGNFWIGTLDDGIYILKNDYADYNTYTNAYTGIVKSSCSSKKGMLFSTSDNKVFICTKDTTEILQDFNKAGLFSRDQAYHAAHYLDPTHFYAFAGEKLLIGPLLGKGVYTYTDPSFSWSTPKSVTMHEGNVYLLTSSRIICIKPQKHTVVSTTIPAVTDNPRLYCMAQDKAGNIWYSGTNHVYKIQNSLAVPKHQFAGTPLKWF